MKVTLLSPGFHASLSWREDVQELWKYLDDHYVIQEVRHSNTIIRIILDNLYTRTDIKRIAQAVIHFEPVFDLFMPDQHEPTAFTRRNWRDHADLGQAGLTQAQSIDYLEEISASLPAGNDRSRRTLVCSHLWPSAHFSWAWTLDAHLIKPVEFGRLPASATSGDVIIWSDLVLSFVHAAIACPSTTQLQYIASNRVGLQYFLTGKHNHARRKCIQGVWWHVDLQTNQPIVRC